jgi:hypothetical protein
MNGAIPPLLNTSSWCGAQLKKHRDNFTLPIKGTTINLSETGNYWLQFMNFVRRGHIQ